jgi:hypothetical protein
LMDSDIHVLHDWICVLILHLCKANQLDAFSQIAIKLK